MADRKSIWDSQNTQLQNIFRWQAENDGRTNAWWQAQREWNARTDEKLHSLSLRLSSLERKVVFFSGVAAAVGSGIGAAIASYVLKLSQ